MLLQLSYQGYLLISFCFLADFSYAYSGETGDDYDEEAISLTTGVWVISDTGTKLERKEKKGSVSTDYVTDQREDPEEDKRL